MGKIGLYAIVRGKTNSGLCIFVGRSGRTKPCEGIIPITEQTWHFDKNKFFNIFFSTFFPLTHCQIKLSTKNLVPQVKKLFTFICTICIFI